eukprot:g1414.t1
MKAILVILTTFLKKCTTVEESFAEIAVFDTFLRGLRVIDFVSGRETHDVMIGFIYNTEAVKQPIEIEHKEPKDDGIVESFASRWREGAKLIRRKLVKIMCAGTTSNMNNSNSIGKEDSTTATLRNRIVLFARVKGKVIELQEDIEEEEEEEERTISNKEIPKEIFILERQKLSDGRTLEYQKTAGAFSNPNPYIACNSLDWLCSIGNILRKERNTISVTDSSSCLPSTNPDLPLSNTGFKLLELFCGSAHHSCALAPYFDSILGIDINSRLIALGKENLIRNKCDLEKIKLVQGNCFAPRIRKLAEKFGADITIVDPPRAGLDEKLIRYLIRCNSSFVYISCNPDKAFRDVKRIQELEPKFVIRHFAIFDHFAHSKHLECGLHLSLEKS